MNVFAEGLTVTIVGMGITMIALLLLSYMLDIFGYISKRKKKVEPLVEESIATAIEEIEEVEDDLELIAVIMAAIASSLETTTDQLQIRSFRRMEASGSNWKSR